MGLGFSVLGYLSCRVSDVDPFGGIISPIYG